MKRHFPDEEYFTLLKMLDGFAQSEGMSIKDELILSKFIDKLSAAIQRHRDNPTRVFGFRVESMFAHIAAALGKCQIISEEDSGALFSIEEDIRRPDFKIITIDHQEFFFEVNNFHLSPPAKNGPTCIIFRTHLKVADFEEQVEPVPV